MFTHRRWRWQRCWASNRNETVVFNPQARASSFKLPPFDPTSRVLRIALKPGFTPSSYEAAAIVVPRRYDSDTLSRVFVARSGDSAWSSVADSVGLYDSAFDVDGNLYLLARSGRAAAAAATAVHISGGRQLIVVPDPAGSGPAVQRFLLESSGEMLLAMWKRREQRMEVFKLELQQPGRVSLVGGPLKSLGGRALLLSEKSSMSSAVAGGPMKPDCVYLATANPDAEMLAEWRLSVYDIRSGGGGGEMARLMVSTWQHEQLPPIWFLPTSRISLPIGDTDRALWARGSSGGGGRRRRRRYVEVKELHHVLLTS